MQMLGSRTDNQQGDNQNSQYNNNNQSESSGFQSAGEPETDDQGGEDDLPF
jgi:single-stranded DNA-binding protein